MKFSRHARLAAKQEGGHAMLTINTHCHEHPKDSYGEAFFSFIRASRQRGGQAVAIFLYK